MKRAAEQVKEFNSAFNVPMLDKPGVIPFDRVTLRHRLIAEENTEYVTGAKIRQDVPNIGNELIDVLYVAIGALLEHGFSPDLIEKMFDEVHRANMDKIKGGTIREDGKIIKPKDHRPPQIGELIKQYELNN